MLPGAFYDELIHYKGDSIGNGLSIPVD
jgi:hypothetical protein